MVLASLRLTFPLSSFGIRYWPINLAGCLERGKWKEVFVSVKEMAWIFYLQLNEYETDLYYLKFKAATANFWQARLSYSLKSRQGLGLESLAIRGGPY